MRRLMVLLFLALPLAAGEARPDPIPFERGRDKLRLELLAARSGLCALNVAAHPDDEDGATIAWLRRVAGVEVHICLATRGEGGQNESGPELGADLAALRTAESEASARILGAKLWYLNLPDFGFSKSDAEALKVWGHERALGRLVRIVRIVKPDILFTNHDPDGADHGHHRATARLVFEAYEAAADPKRFPEQLEKEGLQPWAVAKLYRRLWQPTDATVTVEVSARDESGGYGPAEIAAWALSRHVSQGMNREVKAGERVLRHYVLAKSRGSEPGKERTLLDGLPAVAYGPLHLRPFTPAPGSDDPLRKLQELLNGEATGGAGFALGQLFGSPERDVWAARNALESLQAGEPPGEDAAAKARRARARAHLDAAAVEALGVRLEARPADSIVTAGEEAQIEMRLANTGPFPVTLKSWRLIAEPEWNVQALPAPEGPLAPGAAFEAAAKATATPRACPNHPTAAFLFDRHETRSPLRVEAVLSYEGLDVAMPPVEVPLELAPPFEARVQPSPLLVFDDPDRPENAEVTVGARLVVVNHRREAWKLYGMLENDERFISRKASESVFDFTREEQTLSDAVGFTIALGKLDRGTIRAKTVLWTKEARQAAPILDVRRIPLKLAVPLNVGVVRTYDAATWEALERFAAQYPSLNLVELTPDDLRGSDLKPLHSIVLDLRCTQYRPDVLENRERLKAYMEGGGNVVCLYHKDFDWNEPGEDARGRGIFRGGGGGGAIAPYPLTLSFERVTDEAAPVRILRPEHPLLTKPCRIWEDDWADWVQERGVYFPSKWDEKYEALLASNDEGGKALEGGLLVAQVGEGSFIYTSFVWYRQLRAGVPGAYRMLANLISYPKVKR